VSKWPPSSCTNHPGMVSGSIGARAEAGMRFVGRSRLVLLRAAAGLLWTPAGGGQGPRRRPVARSARHAVRLPASASYGRAASELPAPCCARLRSDSTRRQPPASFRQPAARAEVRLSRRPRRPAASRNAAVSWGAGACAERGWRESGRCEMRLMSPTPPHTISQRTVTGCARNTDSIVSFTIPSTSEMA